MCEKDPADHDTSRRSTHVLPRCDLEAGDGQCSQRTVLAVLYHDGRKETSATSRIVTDKSQALVLHGTWLIILISDIFIGDLHIDSSGTLC